MPDITATRPASGASIESAWGGQVHDMLEGVQAGVVNVTISAGANSWTQAVVFPRPYTVAPVVVACTKTGTAIFWSIARDVTATGFNAGVARKDELNQSAATSCDVAWIAVGTPA